MSTHPEGRECKFITHLYANHERPDLHFIKEVIHTGDGTLKKNFRVIKNYERPFWVTKPFFQTHKEKKESEEITKLDVFKGTESDLGKQVAARLGPRYNGITKFRDVSSSPYLYGGDIRASALIKNAYQTKYPDCVSKYDIGVLDIETNVDTGDITIISLFTKTASITVATEAYMKGEHNATARVEDMYQKYIPDSKYKNLITDKEFKIASNPMEAIEMVFKKAHLWKPDFLVVWNIGFDIVHITDTCEQYGVDPKDIFSDPDIPKEYRYYQYKEGMKQKITASGKFTPVDMEMQWHSVITPASFYVIDAMSAHRYVRVGGKTVSGGYSLDNILMQELGERLMKLKFGFSAKYKGLEWHRHMSKDKPIEYIIYNMWDCMSVLELDNQTKDLEVVLPMLSGASHFNIFNSGPKKIVDGMFFYYKSKGRILGTKAQGHYGNDEVDGLGLDEWIILLPSHRMEPMGLKVINEFPDMRTNIRGMVGDSD